MRRVELNYWPGGRRLALTFSYDDARYEDIRLVELFNKYSLKSTFHICCPEFKECYDFIKKAKVVPYEDYKELYAGHEVSCHTEHHPFPTRLPDAEIVSEIINNRNYLEKIFGYPIRGMSYPFGNYNDRVIANCRAAGMEYARTAAETMGFGIPDDFMKWDATCHHSRATKELRDSFFEPMRFPYLKLFNVWGHSYEFSTEEMWAKMDDFCGAMAGRDDVWYATYVEIMDYINAMYALRFAADCSSVYNPTAISVFISVEGAAVEIPAGQTVKL